MATNNPHSPYESQALKKAVSDAYNGTYQIKGTMATKNGSNTDNKKTITVKK